MYTRDLQPPRSSFFLFGPRGTGKSTWLRTTLKDAFRVTGSVQCDIGMLRDCWDRDHRAIGKYKIRGRQAQAQIHDTGGGAQHAWIGRLGIHNTLRISGGAVAKLKD